MSLSNDSSQILTAEVHLAASGCLHLTDLSLSSAHRHHYQYRSRCLPRLRCGCYRVQRRSFYVLRPDFFDISTGLLLLSALQDFQCEQIAWEHTLGTEDSRSSLQRRSERCISRNTRSVSNSFDQQLKSTVLSWQGRRPIYLTKSSARLRNCNAF